MLKNRRFLTAAVVAAALSLTGPACITSGYSYGHSRNTHNDGRRGYDAGYRDGLSRGEDDARHRREFRVDRDGRYRNADNGYRRGDGDRDSYRRTFRQGYEAGYQEGFGRIGGPRGRGDRGRP